MFFRYFFCENSSKLGTVGSSHGRNSRYADRILLLIQKKKKNNRPLLTALIFETNRNASFTSKYNKK